MHKRPDPVALLAACLKLQHARIAELLQRDAAFEELRPLRLDGGGRHQRDRETDRDRDREGQRQSQSQRKRGREEEEEAERQRLPGSAPTARD